MKTETDDVKPSAMHLYRGAQPVRKWSKYKQTDKYLALCGRQGRNISAEIPRGTENLAEVTCPYCLQLAS